MKYRINHSYRHDVITMIQAFFPNEIYEENFDLSAEGIVLVSRLKDDNRIETYILKNNEETDHDEIALDEIRFNDNDLNKKIIKREVKLSIYRFLKMYTKKELPWGALTGIRPAKLVHDLYINGADTDSVMETLTQLYDVSKEKAELAVTIAKTEDKILNRWNVPYDNAETDPFCIKSHATAMQNAMHPYALYVSIPFCPSKCLYCSFTSYTYNQYKDKADLYIEALIKEISHFIDYKSNDPKSFVESIYIGGGTPTILSAEQLERLLKNITQSFDLTKMLEFTVEAGRPDTITREKLELMKKYGVNRISVNPQTISNKTLDLIGRKHTAEQFYTAYEMAVSCGFSNINIDLIAGLPGESPEDFHTTIHAIMKLSPMPSSVTIHTLAVKRSSGLKDNITTYKETSAEAVSEMLTISRLYCEKNGLFPYYMYRQKNTAGNFENVGYAALGKECIYNVQIMEERQSILAFGAGAITKLYVPEENRLERTANVKNVDEYINRIDEMVEKKRRLLQ